MRRLTAGDYAVDAVTMAKALVGAWLCRRLDDGTVVRRRITETEAYCGEEGTACHAHKGRMARTAVSLATAAGWETRRRCWRTRVGKESECEGHRFVV